MRRLALRVATKIHGQRTNLSVCVTIEIKFVRLTRVNFVSPNPAIYNPTFIRGMNILIIFEKISFRFFASGIEYSMWPLDRTGPGPDALYSSRHFLAESELKLENTLWKDSTIFLHSFFVWCLSCDYRTREFRVGAR